MIWRKKLWMPDPSEKQPFWKAKWPYKLQIFSRVKRVKKSATSKAIWPWKKAVFSRGSGIHSFECQISLMNISNNVEHECLRFSLRIRVFCDLKGRQNWPLFTFSSFSVTLRLWPEIWWPDSLARLGSRSLISDFVFVTILLLHLFFFNFKTISRSLVG